MKLWLSGLLLSLWGLCALGATAQKSIQKPIVVILDWYVNPNHAPLIVAEETGLFKKHGIEVQLIAPADPADGPKWVAAGQADLAVTYQPSFMLQVDAGLPLIRVGTLVPTPLDCLMVLKNGSIHNIADLKNKNIGYSGGGLGHLMLQTMLNAHGLSLKDVRLVNVRYNLLQALLTHRVDAFTGAMRNFELIQIAQSGQTGHCFYPEKNGYPNYEELILVAKETRDRDPRFKAFMEAITESVALIKKTPTIYWNLFAAHYPELNNELNKQAWFETMHYFTDQPAQFDSKKYQEFADFLYRNHEIQKIQPVNRYGVNE